MQITRDNDLTLKVGPVTGLDPGTGLDVEWPGTQVTAWIAETPGSDVALGGVTLTAGEVPPATFFPSFDAAQINAILGAVPNLAEGQQLYGVVKGATGTVDFRRVVPLVYRSSLVAA